MGFVDTSNVPRHAFCDTTSVVVPCPLGAKTGGVNDAAAEVAALGVSALARAMASSAKSGVHRVLVMQVLWQQPMPSAAFRSADSED